MMSRTYIIAEAGVNHNGSLERAKGMVAAAADAGADAVKFQTFRAEKLVTKSAAKAEYQTANDGSGSQFEMLKALELSTTDFVELKACCKSHSIEFLSSPFDLSTIDELIDLGIEKWKIPSGEITNLPYLRKIGSLHQEVILSTGMTNLEEVGAALGELEAAGQKLEQVTLLQCNTDYPTSVNDVNLSAMKTIKDAFPCIKDVGYSDHTSGIEVSIAAVALGASVIEKHFTLDRSLDGPDHKASLEPAELAELVQSIRNIEAAMGDGIKEPSISELKNISVVRKSIVAAVPIAEGEVLTEDNLTVKRPGHGVSPMQWDEIIGKTALRDYREDEMIDA